MLVLLQDAIACRYAFCFSYTQSARTRTHYSRTTTRTVQKRRVNPQIPICLAGLLWIVYNIFQVITPRATYRLWQLALSRPAHFNPDRPLRTTSTPSKCALPVVHPHATPAVRINNRSALHTHERLRHSWCGVVRRMRNMRPVPDSCGIGSALSGANCRLSSKVQLSVVWL